MAGYHACLQRFYYLGPYLICKYTQIRTCRKSSHTTSFFLLEQLSAGSSVQEYRGMYSLFNAEGMRVCMCLCVCSKSSLKQLGQLKPNFMWNHNGMEENLFKGFRSFVVLHLNTVSLWGAGDFCWAFTTNVAPQ